MKYRLLLLLLPYFFISLILAIYGYGGHDFFVFENAYTNLLAGRSPYATSSTHEGFYGYGPILALLVFLFFFLIGGIVGGLLATKICMIVGNTLAAIVLFDLAKHLKNEKFAFYTILSYILNPFVPLVTIFLNTQADGWNAVFILLTLDLFVREKHDLAILALICGFMIKYSPILVIFPIFASAISRTLKVRYLIFSILGISIIYFLVTEAMGTSIIDAIRGLYFFGLKKPSAHSLWTYLPQYYIYGTISIWSLNIFYVIPLTIYFYNKKNYELTRITFVFYSLFYVFTRYVLLQYFVWIIPLIPFLFMESTSS